MTESVPESESEAVPAPAPAPASASVSVSVSERSGKRLRPRRVVGVIGAVLLAGAVVAGVGYTVVTVDGADRDAGAPTFEFPQSAADGDDADADGKVASAAGLAGVLVPYGDGSWSRGPDLGEFGYDAQLSGAQATALRKESLSGLPRSHRKKLEKQLDRQRIKGMAMRSYLSPEAGPLGTNERVYSAKIVLVRMSSSAAVRRIGTSQQTFLDALGVFRAGPKIEGHKNAKCFLPPKAGTEYESEYEYENEDADPGLESMYCSAYQGDILVTATATGPAPLDTKGVAMLLSAQLDGIAEPGEAV